jgi:hypothetical protein
VIHRVNERNEQPTHEKFTFEESGEALIVLLKFPSRCATTRIPVRSTPVVEQIDDGGNTIPLELSFLSVHEIIVNCNFIDVGFSLFPASLCGNSVNLTGRCKCDNYTNANPASGRIPDCACL